MLVLLSTQKYLRIRSSDYQGWTALLRWPFPSWMESFFVAPSLSSSEMDREREFCFVEDIDILVSICSCLALVQLSTRWKLGPFCNQGVGGWEKRKQHWCSSQLPVPGAGSGKATNPSLLTYCWSHPAGIRLELSYSSSGCWLLAHKVFKWNGWWAF